MFEKMNEQIASYGVVPVVVLNDTKDAKPLAEGRPSSPSANVWQQPFVHFPMSRRYTLAMLTSSW